jgi:di/tricarboxylate transporter
MLDIYLIFGVLVGTIILFIWGHWRYDTVALLSLSVLVLLRLVPASEAFLGFGNPAVITVAAVMVITRTISHSGLVEQVVDKIAPLTSNTTLHIGVLTLLTAILSAFMNNVGALGLMMPIAITSAIRNKLSPSKILMPLSFGSVLGGLCTSIGTPPNLLISAYREEVTGTPFSLFDYTPVGLSVAIVGIIFIALIGWRLLPVRQKATGDQAENFPIKDYITEVKIPDKSPVIDSTCRALEKLVEGDVSVLGLIRGRKKILSVRPNEILKSGDILMIEASHDDLQSLMDKAKLKLEGSNLISPDRLKSDDMSVMEAVVTPGSRVEARSWQRMRIRSRFQVNLIAIAREGRAFKKRLNHVSLKPGDVILVQGEAENLRENIINLGLLPLAERKIQIGFKRSMLWPIGTFFAAIIAAVTGFTTISAAFIGAIVVMVLFNVIPMREVYRYIDWSIVTLLAAMIPIGGALQSSGATKLVGDTILLVAGTHSTLLIIGLLLFITMTLSDVMNNAATAVVMSPIALSMAHTLHLGVDPFLMAVTVGASCSFLTPISHQNNTLVMGPGGYKFYDYLRLGIPIEIIVLIVALPAINYFWLT